MWSDRNVPGLQGVEVAGLGCEVEVYAVLVGLLTITSIQLVVVTDDRSLGELEGLNNVFANAFCKRPT